MSGIFGIIQLNNRPVEKTDLLAIPHSMAHRGPDGSDIWLNGSAGFGQLMLHTTEESLHEPLPWRDPESGFVITADARIDNRNELISVLDLAIGSAKTIPDSQLILTAYKKWGKACVDHLLGDFAFAIWNPIDRELFCARDHLGLKPFYYYISAELVVFASAASAVANHPRVPKKIDEGRIADMMIRDLEGINTTCSFYENVKRLPPAHLATLKHNEFTIHRYWSLNSEYELTLATENDYTDALDEVLTSATKARLRSHKPVASMLSGGVDSSTIVGIAKRELESTNSKPLKTYSGISDEGTECPESSYIKKVINHGGLNPVLIRPSEIEKYAPQLQHVEQIFEDPFDADWTLLSQIFLTTKRNGHVAVMDGLEGDLIAGLPTDFPAYLIRDGDIKTAFGEIERQRKHYYRKCIPRWRAYTQAIRPVLTPNFLRLIKRKIQENIDLHTDAKESMLSIEFAKRINLIQRYREFDSHFTVGFYNSLRLACTERITAPYLTAAIERYERLASYSGIEARHPLLDKRVIEFFLSLPWQQKAQNGWSKYCLRNVLARVSPKEVAWRPGWEQISWKFSHARDKHNKVKNLAQISENWHLLENILDAKAFDKVRNGYLIRDSGSIESMMNLGSLLRWLKRA